MFYKSEMRTREEPGPKNPKKTSWPADRTGLMVTKWTLD